MSILLRLHFSARRQSTAGRKDYLYKLAKLGGPNFMMKSL